jgi:SepF-like predicted cell division protein (DUF552 family)
MKFSLFRKPKQLTEPEKPAVLPQEEPKAETTVAAPEEPKQEAPAPPKELAPEPTSAQETAPTTKDQKPEAPVEPVSKTYLKAMPLKELTDVENVKNEVKNGNIVILRVTPLATKSIEDVKSAVNQLYEFAESSGGDIARLGEERVVICPKNIKIWREKSPVSTDSLPTAAPTAA